MGYNGAYLRLTRAAPTHPEFHTKDNTHTHTHSHDDCKRSLHSDANVGVLRSSLFFLLRCRSVLPILFLCSQNPSRRQAEVVATLLETRVSCSEGFARHGWGWGEGGAEGVGTSVGVAVAAFCPRFPSLPAAATAAEADAAEK